MTEWPRVPIKSVSEHVTVGFVGSQAPHFVDSGVPLLRGQNVKPYRLQLDGLKYISADTHNRWKKSELVAGDVVIVRVGYPGTAAVIPAGLGPLNAASLVIVRPDQHLLDSHFLVYLLNSPWGRAAVSARFVGAAQQVLNTGAVADLEIALPGIEIQRRVSYVLRSIDELIGKNSRRVEILEEMARATFDEWFVRFRYPGHEDVPLVDSALGLIPDGWAVHPFDEIADFVNGFAFKPSHWGTDGRPIIKIKELKQGVTASTPRHPAEAIAKKYWVERGDLLFSWSADLGVYLWNHEPGLLNQHLFTVRPTQSGLTIAFLLHSLDSAMPQFRSRAQGTTMRHIKRSALTEVEVVIPPRSLMDRFTRNVKPMHDEIARLESESATLENLRDLLIPKLVTGEVDVAALGIDSVAAESVA